MAENGTDFKLKFDGELNEVDASTLGYSLVNVTGIIKEIGEDIATAQKIEIKVKATAPGSFLIHLTLQAINDPIFDVAGIVALASHGPTILKTLTELFKLRKVLKGDPPSTVSRDGDEVQVTASDNTKIIIDKRTYNYYFTHPAVNDALSKTFRALDNDESITGFEITDAEEKALFEAARVDFERMALSTSVPQLEERDETETVAVHVVKASFDPKLKWDVLYKGNRTSVWVKDEAFHARIERGEERFGKGDVLIVDLKTHQKLDPSLGTYVNKSHEVLRVREHIPRAEQESLFPRILSPEGLVAHNTIEQQLLERTKRMATRVLQLRGEQKTSLPSDIPSEHDPKPKIQ